MRTLVAVAGVVAVLAASAQPATAAPAQSPPVPSDVYIVFNGLDWAWASPCHAIGGCSSIVFVDGFRFATAAEWATRPDVTAFLDAGGNQSGPAGNFRCAAAWFDNNFSHCDYNDVLGGFVSSGPVGSTDPNADTWLVRGESQIPPSVVPEPISMVLLGTGLAGLGAARRSRRRRDGELED
jgi:hypothetical protein